MSDGSAGDTSGGGGSVGGRPSPKRRKLSVSSHLPQLGRYGLPPWMDPILAKDSAGFHGWSAASTRAPDIVNPVPREGAEYRNDGTILLFEPSFGATLGYNPSADPAPGARDGESLSLILLNEDGEPLEPLPDGYTNAGFPDLPIDWRAWVHTITRQIPTVPVFPAQSLFSNRIAARPEGLPYGGFVWESERYRSLSMCTAVLVGFALQFKAVAVRKRGRPSVR